MEERVKNLSNNWSMWSPFMKKLMASLDNCDGLPYPDGKRALGLLIILLHAYRCTRFCVFGVAYTFTLPTWIS